MATIASAAGQGLPQPLLVERLLDPAAYPHPTGRIRLIETHISWVILTGPFVYKLKKPCNLGFLDYTTLERRRHFCAEEVRVSGRFAPALYVAAVPITGSAEAPRVEGAGEPIEWAVKLVQFAEADRLDNRFMAGRLTAADCELLGGEIACVQESLAVAPVDSPWGTAGSVLDAVTINLDELAADRPDAAPRVGRLREWLAARLTAAAPCIEARRAAGRVRECHGDLHLANLVLHDGRMMAFDAIEFSPGLRWIDVANDVAFLAMDLDSRGRPDLAAHVVSAWVEAANDHAAVAVIPIYEVYRAVVRASVAAIRGRDAGGESREAARVDTDRYLDLAERRTAAATPAMFATSGISGSGKSTVAESLVGSCGAVRIRSDVERKRIAGMRPTDRTADPDAVAALYGEAMTRRVYDRLAALARALLAAGATVVVDATCSRRWQRDLLATAAHEAGVPLVWLDCDVPAGEAVERVAGRAARGTDPSDASADIVRMQLASREPIAPDECGVLTRIVRVGEGGPAEVMARVLAAFNPSPAAP